ncbi:MAG: hypothetical protein VKQ33_10825 [Candidatus Sericytochromatia bacterium]|nr:hypothetical protein [Candidatus Sericytochromatia bacterium]
MRKWLLTTSTGVLTALAGCQGGLAPQPTRPQAAALARRAKAPAALPNPRAADAGVVSNNGGALTEAAPRPGHPGLVGRLRVPATLLSDQGGTLLSDQGGTLLSDQGGALRAPTGRFRLAQGGALVQVPLSKARVELRDATGAPVLDDAGSPLVTQTDATGAFEFDAALPARNLVVVAPLAGGVGAIRAVATRDARGQVLEADLFSTLTATYILGKFVAPQTDQQRTLDRLPGEVAAETRDKVAAALPGDARPVSLTTDAVLQEVDALRAGNEALDAQLRHVERLLVAGLSNLGEGLPALQVPLSGPHRLVALSDGTLFVSEEWASRIRRLDPDGTIRAFAGEGPDDGATTREGADLGDGLPALKATLDGPSALAADAAGNLYVCDQQHHRIRRIDARSGVITTVAGSRPVVANTLFAPPVLGGVAIEPGTPGPEAPITTPHAIAVDADGRCVFACQEGTYRLEADGSLMPLPLAGLHRTPEKLASTPGGEVIASFGQEGFARVQGEALVAATDIPPRPFLGPHHLAAGPGNVLYAQGDRALHRFQDGAWRQLLDLAGMPTPNGLTANAEAVWITSDLPGQVWRYTLATGSFERVAGIQWEPGQGLRGDQLLLNHPAAVAFDDQDRLLVADGLNGIVWRREDDGLYHRVAGNGTMPGEETGEARLSTTALETALGICTAIQPSAAGGLLLSASFRVHEVSATGALKTLTLPDDLEPLQVVRDAAGALVVSDSPLMPMAGRVVRIADGVVTELVPRKAVGAYLGLLPRPDGSLYYCDVLAGVVYRRSAAGAVTAVAGAPAASGTFAGDGGPATAAGLNFPMSLALDAAGNVYIADASNHRVRRVDATSGLITTLAGEGGRVFNGRGPDASLHSPRALAFDAAGNLHIADAGHNQVKQVPRGQLGP